MSHYKQALVILGILLIAGFAKGEIIPTLEFTCPIDTVATNAVTGICQYQLGWPTMGIVDASALELHAYTFCHCEEKTSLAAIIGSEIKHPTDAQLSYHYYAEHVLAVTDDVSDKIFVIDWTSSPSQLLVTIDIGSIGIPGSQGALNYFGIDDYFVVCNVTNRLYDISGNSVVNSTDLAILGIQNPQDVERGLIYPYNNWIIILDNPVGNGSEKLYCLDKSSFVLEEIINLSAIGITDPTGMCPVLITDGRFHLAISENVPRQYHQIVLPQANVEDWDKY